jgi:ADP-ribosylation factor 1/2
MIGLEGSGKTSILQRLKHGKRVKVDGPTLDFNFETILFEQSNRLQIWDVGGRDKELWRNYYND